MKTLQALVLERLNEAGGGPALSIEGSTTPADALRARVGARVAALADAGFGAGARALVTSRRGVDVWVDCMAVWVAGGVAVPLDPQLDPGLVARVVEKAQAAVCLGDASCAPGVPGLPELEAADARPVGPLTALHTVGPDDVAAILFTSGSTGAPKGVVLSHEVVLGNAEGICAALPLGPGDRLAIAIPFHFTSAICHFLATLLTRAQLVATEQSLLPRNFADFLAESGANCFGGAPVQLAWIAQAARERPVALDWVMSSGDHLSPEIIAALRAALPACGIYTVYGLTELGGRFCVLPDDELDTQAGTVGRPIEGLGVTVLDDDGRPCPVGVAGEVVAEGRLMLKSYFGDPAATAAVLDGNRFRTGDLGYLNDAGNLVLTGRKDDVFKVNGQKVSAIVVQDALRETGMFADVAVIPLEDPALGMTPCACFVSAPDAAFDRSAVLRAMRKALPPHFLPRKFVEVAAIPRTGSGKVRRAELRRLVTDGEKQSSQDSVQRR